MNTHTHTHTHTVPAGPELTEQDDCVSRVEYILLKLPARSTPFSGSNVLKMLGSYQAQALSLLSQDAVVTRWTERKSEHGSGKHDGSDYSIFSLVVVGGQEWMSLIHMSAISLALTLARCLSFVQNGAGERRRKVMPGGNIGCMGTESWRWVCPQESTGLSRLEFEPFSASRPCNRRTLISFRKAIKYLKASSYLLLDVGQTKATDDHKSWAYKYLRQTQNRQNHPYQYHQHHQFSSFLLPTNSLCMALHM